MKLLDDCYITIKKIYPDADNYIVNLKHKLFEMEGAGMHKELAQIKACVRKGAYNKLGFFQILDTALIISTDIIMKQKQRTEDINPLLM